MNPSFLSCGNLFDLISSPVPSLSLWPLLSCLFSPVDYSKSTKGGVAGQHVEPWWLRAAAAPMQKLLKVIHHAEPYS